MTPERREALTEALTAHAAREAGAEADHDVGLAPQARHSGAPEPQRLSDAPVGLEHTQLMNHEKKGKSSAPLCIPPMPYKIKGLNKIWASLFAPTHY